MSKFSDSTIKSIIGQLNENYFLPDIQRDYVWLQRARDRKIENLFDSILRGYPIGSFLFWKLKKSEIASGDDQSDNSKLNFQLYKFQQSFDERHELNEKIDVNQIKCDDLNIVLDGQQRLTSLYIGLKGSITIRAPRKRRLNPNAYIERRLYLNLRHEPQAEDPDDNYHFEFFSPTEVPKEDTNNYWFKVGDILEIPSLFSYARSRQLNNPECDLLEKLKNAFCDTEIISYYTENEKNLDKVLKIFIRVNSGGTQLSYSDLLMSILTATFSSDIRKLMNDLVGECRDAGFGVMGRDQILKTCLLLTDSNQIFKISNFTKTNIHKIEQNWEALVTAIRDALSLVADFGYTAMLSSGYILTTIALYLYRKKISYSNVCPQDRKAMDRFVKMAQIKSYFTTSLDNKLRIVYDEMCPAVDFTNFNQNMAARNELNLTSNDIDDMMTATYGSPQILPILQLLYPDLDYKNSIFHIDHIYPKAKFNIKNKALPVECIDKKNAIFNLQLLQGKENITKRDKDPEEWLQKIYVAGETADDAKAKIIAYKKRNYIQPDFELSWENIAQFAIDRHAEIKKQLQLVLR